MFNFLGLSHILGSYTRFPEHETALYAVSDRNLGCPGDQEVVDNTDPSLRADLAVFGLLPMRAEGPTSLHTLDDLPARDFLGVIGLVRSGAGGETSRQPLEAASPSDLLWNWSLLG